MSRPYRLLHLEDNALDAELVQARLALDGLPAEIRVVYTEADFAAALRSETFDAILADYMLPAFDGLSALALARTQLPDVPFIFVTGELGEERAIETLQQGATDYVLKSRLSRLRPAVQRALAESTERRARLRAEAAAEAEREWLRVTLGSIGDAVIASDIDGRITFINPVAESITGWHQAEAIGQPVAAVFQIVNEITRATVESPVDKVLREGVIAGLANHTILICRDGSEIPIDDSGAPIRDTNGQLLGVVLVFRDITPRRASEAALRTSEERYRLLVSATTAVVWVADAAGRVVAPQAAWEAYTGQGWPAHAGDNWLEMIHPEERVSVQDRWRQAIAARSLFSTRGRLWQAANQTHRYSAIRIAPVLDASGEVREWVGTITDIHDRVVAQNLARQAAERTARLQSVTAALSGAVTPSDVFAVVLGEGIAAVQGAAGAVVLRSSTGDTLEVVRSTSTGAQPLIQRFGLMDTAPAAEVTRLGEPIWIESHTAFASLYPHLAEERGAGGYEAAAYVPLTAGARLAGCLVINFSEARSFSLDEQGFLLTLTAQCAQALERADLYTAEQQARERATGLAQVTTALSKALDPEQVTEVILHQAAAVVGAAAVTVFLVDDDGQWLTRLASVGYPDQFREPYQRFAVSPVTPAGEVALTGEPIWLSSADAYRARFPQLVTAINAIPYEALAVVPLRYAGRVNGILGLSFSQELDFTADVRTFITGLADNCVQALERARLYAQTQALNAALEARVQERTRALEGLNDELRTANTELEEQISVRRQAETQIRLSEKQLQEAQHLASVGSWQWNVATGELAWSQEMYRIYGVTPGETPLSYESFIGQVHPDDRERVQAAITQAAVDHRPFTFDHRIVRPDGSVRTLNARGEVAVDGDGRIIAMNGTGQDVSERKAIEEELRQLSAHLHAAREEERKRIAREIHDELGGNMTGLKMALARLANAAPKLTTAEVAAQAQAIARDIDGTVQAIRRISTELRPALLDDFGLLAAIEWQLNEFQGRSHIECEFMGLDEDPGLPAEQATAMFRVFQETLTNVARHAQATQVLVSLEMDGDDLEMRVRDNGRGITEAEAAESRSLGLLGMRERIRLIGGEIEIRGQPGQGTLVRVRIPVRHAAR
jgi:PAS domain S-box-containing protein